MEINQRGSERIYSAQILSPWDVWFVRVPNYLMFFLSNTSFVMCSLLQMYWHKWMHVVFWKLSEKRLTRLSCKYNRSFLNKYSGESSVTFERNENMYIYFPLSPTCLQMHINNNAISLKGSYHFSHLVPFPPVTCSAIKKTASMHDICLRMDEGIISHLIFWGSLSETICCFFHSDDTYLFSHQYVPY